MIRFTSLILGLFLLFACDQTKTNKEEAGMNDQKASVTLNESVPENRVNIKKESIASHVEKTDDPLNDWYFSVRLFETEKTFQYRMQLQFEEIRGTDTLKIPDLGIAPEPVIRKGEEKYSCIIGFLDKDKQFREYKKVHVKNNTLKVTSLKHYAVTTR